MTAPRRKKRRSPTHVERATEKTGHTPGRVPATARAISRSRALRTAFALGVGGTVALLAAGLYQSLRTEGRLPGISTVYMRYIESLFDAGRHEEALDQLHLARTLDIVNEPLVLNNLANAMQAQGKTSEAIAYYGEAIRIQPDYAMAYYNLAKALAEQGDAARAVELYRTAVELDPDHVDAHNNLANLLAGQGVVEEAISHYERALSLQPDNAVAHNNLANVLAVHGPVEQAIRHYEQALRLQPDNAAAHNNLAWVLKGAGRRDEALPHFQEAVRLQPDFASPLMGLSWLLSTHPEDARRDPERALELAGRALELLPATDPRSLDIAAAAHAAVGDYDRAVELARAAADLAPPNFPESQAIQERLALYHQCQPYREGPQ